jgi:hypothetical protein
MKLCRDGYVPCGWCGEYTALNTVMRIKNQQVCPVCAFSTEGLIAQALEKKSLEKK